MTYFKQIEKINYEGVTSENPFAFRHYNPEEVVFGEIDEGAFALCGCLLAYHDSRRI
ncbi:xylose isomerase [Listeria fleischmannii subsp. fleischmannii LU2006-1]|nr:xylose isomerase [Listeria fleischmannii subsp. fleischmannii LU2006-1]